MSSEEEGSTGPEDNEGTLGLQKEIADLKSERAAMAQQLECQQLLIKQLQQQLASLEEMVRSGPAAVQQQQEPQHRQQQQHQQNHQQPHQQQQQEHQENIEMDSVGSPAAYPEVIIDEGDPFNFVRSRKNYKKSKIVLLILMTTALSQSFVSNPDDNYVSSNAYTLVLE
ncbi:antigen LPMC-61-like [Hermetia illucens]|uniref:antigen LPMC-61-like n=1 Tax=Hermetia illucens TaxID=343691 RepID=UPI0018CC2924|nr:antigen LPMC-61-like [Hermetia illucens]